MARQTRQYSEATRRRAHALRRRGYTYTEICDRLGRIPKGTLAHWFRNVELGERQKKRIQDKILASAARGRPLANVAWEKKMKRWRDDIENRVRAFGRMPHANPVMGKIVCGVMYLCEGAKYPTSRHMGFGNTDPRIIRTFLKMLRRHYDIDERKWRVRVMHRWDQDGEALNRYWSKVTRIPRKQSYPSYADRRTKGQATRRHNYKGVCCVQYCDTTLQYELQAIGESILRDAKRKNGGAAGDRTPGLDTASVALSQLSYCPTRDEGGREHSTML